MKKTVKTTLFLNLQCDDMYIYVSCAFDWWTMTWHSPQGESLGLLDFSHNQ